MTKGFIVAAGIAISCVSVAAGLGGTAAGSNESRIEARVLLDTAGGREASFLIRLRDQADLTRAYRMRNQDARGWYVYRALRGDGGPDTEARFALYSLRVAFRIGPSGLRT